MRICQKWWKPTMNGFGQELASASGTFPMANRHGTWGYRLHSRQSQPLASTQQTSGWLLIPPSRANIAHLRCPVSFNGKRKPSMQLALTWTLPALALFMQWTQHTGFWWPTLIWNMHWWLPMKAYPKLPTTATVLPAFCSEMVQPLQSLNMLRMPCIPVIWVQMERVQNISMHTVHCHAPRS